MAACASTASGETSQARGLIAQGDELFARDRPQDALRAYSLAAVAAEEEQERELLVCALSQVATIHFLGRAAGASIRQGETWLGEARIQAREKDAQGWSRYSLARGCYELALARDDSAFGMFSEAAAFARVASLPALELQATHMAARCSAGERRAEWLQRCLDIARAAGERRWEIPLYFNLGAFQEEANKPALARRAYEQALAAARDVGLQDEELAASWAAGRAARLAGEVGPARMHLESARLLAAGRQVRLTGDTSLSWIARCEFELGELDAALGSSEQALAHWKAARLALLRAGTRADASLRTSTIDLRIAALSRAMEGARSSD